MSSWNHLVCGLITSLAVALPTPSWACAYGVLGSTTAFSDADAKEYRVLCNYGPCSLAIDQSGAWGAGCGFSDITARESAISACKKNSQSPANCVIMDVNQASDFIKSPEKYLANLLKSEERKESSEAAALVESSNTKISDKTPSNEDPAPLGSVTSRLRQLRELVEQGLITEDDYNQAKKQILDNM